MLNFFRKPKPIEAPPETEVKEVTSVNLLQDIAHNIRMYGEHKPKKHGEWVCLTIGEFFFAMDTWNGAIAYKKGVPQYEYWTGFSGETIDHLGLSDAAWRSGDSLPLSFKDYEKYLLIIRDYVIHCPQKKETTS